MDRRDTTACEGQSHEVRRPIALELSIGTSAPGLDIKQDGEKIAGTYTSARYGTFPIKGTLKERRLQFVVPLDVDGTAVEMSFAGEVAADAKSIAGTVAIPGMDDGSWSAQRPKSLSGTTASTP